MHPPSSIFVILQFIRVHLKFTVYGRKQASKHTHARAQFSHASVGPARLRLAPITVLCCAVSMSVFGVRSVPQATV